MDSRTGDWITHSSSLGGLLLRTGVRVELESWNPGALALLHDFLLCNIGGHDAVGVLRQLHGRVHLSFWA
jgi:hypothetical protein